MNAAIVDLCHARGVKWKGYKCPAAGQGAGEVLGGLYHTHRRARSRACHFISIISLSIKPSV